MAKMTAKLRALAVALLALPTAALSQVQVKLTAAHFPGGAPIAWDYPGPGAVYVSPYTGVLMATNQTVVMNCVDFFHHAVLNTPWMANQTWLNSGDLSLTRFGPTMNAQAYLQAAWLTTQYPSGLGDDPYTSNEINRTIAIQSAIWNIFASTSPDKITGTNPANDQYDSQWWIQQSLTNWNTVDASRFFVLTATNARYANGADNPNSTQEFLVYDKDGPPRTTVPEPATLILMGTSAAVLAGAARRRRRKELQ